MISLRKLTNAKVFSKITPLKNMNQIIINKISSKNFFNLCFLQKKVYNDHYYFSKITKKNFSISLSFKNKLNSFFKYVHPDVLGRDTPEDYRKTNEKSIQEINSYLDNLNSIPNFFEKKTIYFYIKIEINQNKEKNSSSKDLYEKVSVDLEILKPDMTQSNKFAIQSKYIKYFFLSRFYCYKIFK